MYVVKQLNSLDRFQGLPRFNDFIFVLLDDLLNLNQLSRIKYIWSACCFLMDANDFKRSGPVVRLYTIHNFDPFFEK